VPTSRHQGCVQELRLDNSRVRLRRSETMDIIYSERSEMFGVTLRSLNRQSTFLVG